MAFDTWMSLLEVVACHTEGKYMPKDAIDGRRRYALVKKGFIKVTPKGTLEPTKQGLDAKRAA